MKNRLDLAELVHIHRVMESDVKQGPERWMMNKVSRLRIDKNLERQKSKEFELDRDLVTPPKSFKFGYPTKFGYTI